jgi:hypothetical protein
MGPVLASLGWIAVLIGGAIVLSLGGGGPGASAGTPVDLQASQAGARVRSTPEVGSA